jgi:hypothetical protein
VEQKDQDIIDRFKQNPDGTWTSVKAAPLKVGNRTITISEGMTFTKGEPFMFVDVAEYLDGLSK